jgi:hypothetical protein
MSGSIDEVGQLLVHCPSEDLDAYPISRRVNSPKKAPPRRGRNPTAVLSGLSLSIVFLAALLESLNLEGS